MASIYLRLATESDAPQILQIINSAKAYLRQQGIDQWQNHYPNSKSVHQDINQRTAYVLIYNHQIAGVASLITGIDSSYLKIQNGTWINGPRASYATIHRVAISNHFRGKGLSQILMSNLISLSITKGFNDVRIDTHPQNRGMQHIILANGFKKRGIIHTLEGGKQNSTIRYAYQLIIAGDSK